MISIVQDIRRGLGIGEKETGECPTEGIPPWHGIRWLRDCHSQVGKIEADILAKGITPELLN